MMKVNTVQVLIDEVAEKYKTQYLHKWNEIALVEHTHKDIHGLILAAKTEEELEVAIGGKGWGEIRCNECGNDCDITVRMGEEPDYKSATANLCLRCLQVAVESVRQLEKTDINNKTWDHHNIANIANALFDPKDLGECQGYVEEFHKITPRMASLVLRAAMAYNRTESEAELLRQLNAGELF